MFYAVLADLLNVPRIAEGFAMLLDNLTMYSINQ